MQATVPEARQQSDTPDRGNRQELLEFISRAGALLPMPGPITAMAFLNTLQALEHLPFDEGLRQGARLYGCQPYLSEDKYRDYLTRGRIRVDDLSEVVQENLGDRVDVLIGTLGTRFGLRMAMLQYPLLTGPAAELRWFVAETDALKRIRPEASPLVRASLIQETRHWIMRDLRIAGGKGGAAQSAQAQQLLAGLPPLPIGSAIESWSDAEWESVTLQTLWRICHAGVQGVDRPSPPQPAPLRHRDSLRAASGEDSDALVHDVLIRFCAAFTDQGFAGWTLPDRKRGFFKSFCGLYRRRGGPLPRWLAGLPEELARFDDADLSPLDSIEESLACLGVKAAERFDFILATLLALRGWAGMLWQMEVRDDRVPIPAPPGTLAEFLAVRLILDRWALACLARETGLARDTGITPALLSSLRESLGRNVASEPGNNVEQRAFHVFQLAQILGWSPPALGRLTANEWSILIAEIDAFSGLERRWVFQQAFERQFRIRALDAISIHARRQPERVTAPRFQVSFCLDAREESFRRHLEEIAPDTETFGAPGFYGVAMYYRGAADAHYATLCPIVVRPKHWVVEDVVYSLAESHRRRAKTRRAVGTATHQFHVRSRGITQGAILTVGVGVLASIPLVARVLFPRLTARIRSLAGRFMAAPPVTRLRLERSTPQPGIADDSIGYSLEEMAGIGERMLRDIGLTSRFSRLVFILGHGSFCLNNPHKSAYDCGACSGSPGGANGRALASILNDLRVREILAERGLRIPPETVFVGGLHNTAVDSLTFFDLDLLPRTHYQDFEAARRTLHQVCERNAHERCRRFNSAPLDLTIEAAHRHVEERSEDLAQARPEFGNASNALCIVGRRERTRGLYLDRRSFLTSYDPTQDDAEHTILARILSAAVPVCEGINMQYYLSYVDSPGWACGTKLPHNVTSLLGVMDGASSDLRPGLPWQSVEIHEPVRLLFVIETTPQAMLDIMQRNEVINRILKNGWAQLAVLDPGSPAIQVYRDGRFHGYRPETTELAKAGSSHDWYRGWREHLEFAEILN